jgi:hypothetical protein
MRRTQWMQQLETVVVEEEEEDINKKIFIQISSRNAAHPRQH